MIVRMFLYFQWISTNFGEVDLDFVTNLTAFFCPSSFGLPFIQFPRSPHTALFCQILFTGIYLKNISTNLVTQKTKNAAIEIKPCIVYLWYFLTSFLTNFLTKLLTNFLTHFLMNFLTYNLLPIASFRIEVPLIFFLNIVKSALIFFQVWMYYIRVF